MKRLVRAHAVSGLRAADAQQLQFFYFCALYRPWGECDAGPWGVGRCRALTRASVFVFFCSGCCARP